MSLQIVDHPLARVLISQLRNKDTLSPTFRKACRNITQMLILEATKTMSTRPVEIETPLESTEGSIWDEYITLIPIIRAGIAMVDPILEIFPEASVGYLGLERDEETTVARNYYRKIPHLKNQTAIIVDPLLATGGSLLQAIEICRKEGAEKILIVTILAAPEGVEAVSQKHPDITIITAVMDRELNQQKYILPGLGDFGDRLFNT
tara:strand:- start:3972 stop:4589 length:618 start_codon:yes stop_codon:yes gene_type:complete